ncbi:MAG TPA: alginate lyase family protein [Longimicrobiales bacterium]
MGALERVVLYARTARHLRWEQWVYRPVRRIQSRLPARVAARCGFDGAVAPALAAAVQSWGAGDVEARLRRADDVVSGTFRFLNHEERLPSIAWDRRPVSHLWSYNLHYFDYALDLAWAWRHTGDARYAARFVELAESWIRGCPAGRGDGWEPYPVSLRTVNWVYAVLLFGEGLGARPREAILRSAAEQLAFLARRLEYHILANHLLKNVKALVVGGAVFTGREAARWRAKGRRLLRRELFEQVLPDGAHYERAPMYHAIALGDLLEVVSLLDAAGEPVADAARERVRRMADAFGVLSRPDGTLHRFNDSANAGAPDRRWLDALARGAVGQGIPAPAGVVALPDAGFHGFVDPANGARLIVDGGAPGPAYQPGHSHCGALSFELDLGGRPVVVDSGVHGYDGDPFREYARSTRAHNTVMIADREQSEVWGTFRVARRAAVRVVTAEPAGGGYRFAGACTPYHDRSIVHRRVIEGSGDAWSVTDVVAGGAGAVIRSFLHLHPDFRVERDGPALVACAGDVCVRIEPFGIEALELRRGSREPVQGWYFEEFGSAVPAPAVEMRIRENHGRPFGYRIRRVGRR